jgi:hypothetical protein
MHLFEVSKYLYFEMYKNKGIMNLEVLKKQGDTLSKLSVNYSSKQNLIHNLLFYLFVKCGS